MALDPSLDESAIEQLRSLGSPNDGDDFLREVVAVFLDDSPVRIAELGAALRAGDALRFTRAAHSLKGSAANIGAASMKMIADVLEQRSRERGLAGLGPEVDDLQAAFVRTKAAFARLVASEPSSPAHEPSSPAKRTEIVRSAGRERLQASEASRDAAADCVKPAGDSPGPA
ncbi:MAG: Hpt domain-containing protein [Opitutaceae bacterium]